MRRNGSSLLAVIAVAVALVGARRAPIHSVVQATDACWFRPAPAQGEAEKRKSAHDSASVAMEGGTVKVCYGRPRVNGREIMGKLVPYGEPWRLGADEATAIYVPFRASIAGVNQKVTACTRCIRSGKIVKPAPRPKTAPAGAAAS